jgi:hypothetical protein
MGPLGLILLFQGLIAILERFSMSAEKSDEAIKVFGSSVTENTAKLKILVKVLNDTNFTTEEQISIIQNNKKGLEEMGFEVGNTTEAMGELQEAMEQQIIVGQKMAIAQGFANVIQEQYNDIAEVVAAGLDDNLELYEKAAIKLNMTGISMQGLTEEQKKQVIVGQKLQEMNKKIEGSYEMLTKRLEDGDMYINYIMNGGDKKGASKRARAQKIFKEQFLSFDKIIESFNKQERLNSTRNEEEKLKIQEEYAIKDIDLRVKNFKARQTIRYNDYLESIKGLKNEDELREKANEKYLRSIKKAEEEAGEAKLSIRSAYAIKIDNKIKEIAMKLRGEATSQALSDIGRDVSGIDPQALLDPTLLFEQEEARFARNDFLTDALTQAQEGGNKQEIAAARQNLFDFEEQIRQEDILAEQAYYQDKKNIQLEYIGFLKASTSIFKTIAGDNEKLQKIVLVAEKASAISEVVIGAEKSIARRIFENTKLGPIASAADAIPMARDITRTKISAALSIANILAQGNGKGSVKGGATGGGGQGGRAFDFNLVGSTGTNQLAEAVGGQFQQPVQAYVVSSEMTSQQELDLQIEAGASVGD